MPGRLAATFAALGVLAGTGSAAARPFTVDDLLAQEAFGEVAIDPTGRWLVYERRGPYDSAPRFDHGQANPLASSRLRLVDLLRPGPGAPLAAEAGPGLVAGPFSPDGAHMAVTRLSAGRWELGVVTLADGTTRWLGVTPERAYLGRTLQWRADRTLLVLARPGATPSWSLRLGRLSAEALPVRWAAAAVGATAVTVVGSGALLDVRTRPPPLQLLEIDIDHGTSKVLATGAFTDLELAPDGRRVAVREAGADLQPRVGRPAQGDDGTGLQAEHLAILDLETGGRLEPCSGLDVMRLLLAWSPAADALLVYARDPNAGWSAGRLLRIDAATGAARAVDAGLRPVVDGRPEGVQAAWMGRDPIVLAKPAGAGPARPDWWRLAPTGPVRLTGGLPEPPQTLTSLDAHGLVAVVDGTAVRVDRMGGVRRIAGHATQVRRPRVGADGRAYGAASERGWIVVDAGGSHPRLRAVGAAPRADEFVLPAGAGITALAAHDAVVTRTDAQGITRLDLVRVHHAPLPLDVVNARLRAVAPAEVRRIDHLGPDGQALHSWLFLPRRAPGAPPPPLLVRVYAGDTYPTTPRPEPAVLGLPADLRVMVGHGYAVLLPSLPPPHAATNDPLQGLADQVLAVVDRAAQDPLGQGAFDPKHVGLWGFSFGGYSVLGIVGQTDRFRAAVSVSGISDLTAKWSSLSAPHRALQEEGPRSNAATGSVEVGQSRMGVPPWSDPARYVRNSPLYAADRIVTPLFLAAGDQDPIVAPAQSEAMFSALYRQGKDAELAIYWGEGHQIASPGNVRDLYARAFSFLDPRLGLRPAATAANPESALASVAPTPPSSPPAGSPPVGEPR